MSGIINTVELRAHANRTFFDSKEGGYIADKIIKWTEQNGRSSPIGPGLIIDEAIMGKAFYDSWTAPEVLAFFQARIKPPKPVSVWSDPESIEFQTASITLGREHFLCCRGEAGVQIFEKTDILNREVVPVGAKPSTVTAALTAAVMPIWEREDIAASAKRVAAFHQYVTGSAKDEPPRLLGQPGGTDWCLHRAKILPDPKVQMPWSREFLDRVIDPPVLGAFFWGVYSGLNRGRQILYISDKRGEGGKSQWLSSVVSALFGDRIAGSIPATVLAAGDIHASSHFVGKKIAVAGDNRSPHIIHSPMMKLMTGDDKSFINPKYQQPYAAFLECRVIIASNYEPAISRDHHNRSRTLWLKLAPLMIPDEARDPRYGEKCVAELPGFLAWARDCYAERCDNDYAIRTNAAVHAAVERRIAECETHHKVAFDEHFTLDQDGSLLPAEWARVTKELLKLDSNATEDFKNWITTAYPVLIDDDGLPGCWYFVGMRLRRRSETHSSSQPTDTSDNVRLLRNRS